MGEKVSEDPEVRNSQMNIKPEPSNPETFATVGKFGFVFRYI